MADWTEKYRPSSLAEVRGNDKAVSQLRDWAEGWTDHPRALILYGPPGIGKTSAAHALASEMGWAAIELNASDQRTADEIERVAGGAARNRSLSGSLAGRAGRQLVIVDEADNFHGNADRGGARAMTDLVKDAGQPVILIANEFYEMSNALRDACETVEFSMRASSIVPALRHICREEGIDYEEAALERIAERNASDLRGAVNDLQALAEGREALAVADVEAGTGERDRERGIFEYLDLVIKEADAREALEASYEVDETPDDLINWIEDNLPKDYSGEELALAYRSLADADRWLGRVRATQNYSFWRYAADAMTAGVAAARRESKGGWTRYGPPSYWSKLGRSRSTREKRDYVARQMADQGGTSMGTARRELLPYLAAMTHHCKNRELTVAMAARYDLNAEHIAFVTGSGKDTNKVQSIVEDARELRERDAVDRSEGAFTPRQESTEVADQTQDGGDGASSTTAGGSLDEFEEESDQDRETVDSTAGEATTDMADHEGDPPGGADDPSSDPAEGSTEETEDDPTRTDQAAEDDEQSGLGDFL